ncbi:dTDP-4-dehydrorhamnose 3,5-epimerase [Magnetococcus sp. PR-3]|uniref:dTDP-4-dehydrorhamnose 3,5-epimerase n=1 Tax=Magnetococcus sp. PR-3 TaxID=3120355 RepID=UPI002FCE3CE4
MNFEPLALEGAYRIPLKRLEDSRGYFARSYCEAHFKEAGLNTHWPQSNLSLNHHRGTLRGMHFQHPPHGEIKLVSCLQGSLFDVLVDLRPNAPSYGQWLGITLEASNPCTLYIPNGVAHGFQTLEDDTLVHYQMGSNYHPQAQAGFLWNDPKVGIQWPHPDIAILSAKDAELPMLAQAL